MFFKLWPWLEKNRNALIGAGVALIAAAGIWYYVTTQRAQSEIDAGQALTALLVSPEANASSSELATELGVLAGKFSGTAAGRRAQLQAAGALFDAGNYAEAQTQFQKCLNDDPTGPYAATAELGIATCMEAQNQLDQAATAYQRVVSGYSSSTCVAQAELALGRLAEQQNRLNEAMDYYGKAVSASLAGTVRNEASMRAEELREKLAAAAPKPAAATTPAAPATSASPFTITPATAPTPAPAVKPAAKP